MDLSERKRGILRAVVEHYIQTAEPVGSKTVVEMIGKAVSSATIRNEMSELEFLGLLEQPHTSAGRIPSPRGYRLYVNELMEEHRLSMGEIARINESLRMRMAELDRVISESVRIVSRLTSYPAFSLAAGGARVTIRRFDLLLVERDAFIAVLMADNNAVRNKLFRLPGDLTGEQLRLLARLLNASFAGLTTEEMTPELMDMAARAAGEAYGILSMVVAFAIEVLEELERHSVHTAGLTNLLTLPEYRDLARARPLMEFLEHTDPGFLPPPGGEQARILIGPENVAEALKETSVILASYDIGDNMRGIIGVVGPTRMDYAKLAARLTYFADGMARMFGHQGGGDTPGALDRECPR